MHGKYLMAVLVGCFVFAKGTAQQWNRTVPKTIIILQSTHNYRAALQTAKQAAKLLGKKLDLEENYPDKTLGLSLTRKDCEGNGYDYPCYTARGEGAAQDSDYLSIEYSDAYEGFAKGYYIVVAGLATPGSQQEKKILSKARLFYKNAYAKRTKVWFGCMH